MLCPRSCRCLRHFNPRSPCGERHAPGGELLGSYNNFNPRSPCGERHRRRVAHHAGDEFQSTLPVRGATLPQRAPLRHMGISIHAPRAGSDSSTISSMSVRSYFNPRSPCGERRFADGTFEFWRTISIHAPRAGSDQERMDTRVVPLPFQSTLPVRGATFEHAFMVSSTSFQSTLPVRGAT